MQYGSVHSGTHFFQPTSLPVSSWVGSIVRKEPTSELVEVVSCNHGLLPSHPTCPVRS